MIKWLFDFVLSLNPLRFAAQCIWNPKMIKVHRCIAVEGFQVLECRLWFSHGNALNTIMPSQIWALCDILDNIKYNLHVWWLSHSSHVHRLSVALIKLHAFFRFKEFPLLRSSKMPTGKKKRVGSLPFSFANCFLSFHLKFAFACWNHEWPFFICHWSLLHANHNFVQ